MGIGEVCWVGVVVRAVMGYIGCEVYTSVVVQILGCVVSIVFVVRVGEFCWILIGVVCVVVVANVVVLVGRVRIVVLEF